MCYSKVCRYEHREGYCKLPENCSCYPEDADCNCVVEEDEVDVNTEA